MSRPTDQLNRLEAGRADDRGFTKFNSEVTLYECGRQEPSILFFFFFFRKVPPLS